MNQDRAPMTTTTPTTPPADASSTGAPPAHRWQNRLLRSLPAQDLALLTPHMEAVDLPRGKELLALDQPFEHAWFVEAGILSVIAVSPEDHRVEACLVGRDGFAPAPLLLGVGSMPYQLLVQVPGHGLRLPAAALAAAIDASPTLRRLLGYYLETMITQTAYTALSNAVHQVDERCARWLLMVHDRVEGDDIQLTHEVLSSMLAVRRPSVTTALHVLEGNRLIRADRGWVTVRDRAALEEFAGDAYGRSETEYARLIGPLK